MATIEKRGDTYRIMVSAGYDSAGKQIKQRITWTPPADLTPAKLKKALQAAAVEFENKVKTGQYISCEITLGEFAARWMKEYGLQHLEATTYQSYECELKTKILPALGHIKLGKLQPVQILGFLNSLLEPGCRVDGRPGAYSNRTVKYQHAILSSILQTAVFWQIILTNPCERVKIPKANTTGEEKRLQFFTDDQCIRFLGAAKGEDLKYQAITMLAIYGGFRRGEILGLTWDDVDFDAGTISIKRSNTYLPGWGIITKATKTSGSTRVISLPETVLAVLRRHKQRQAEDRLKLGELWKGAGLLFTQWDGKPMHPTTPRLWMHDLITKYNKEIIGSAALSEDEKRELTLPCIPFHGLRHTSATLMIANNTDVKTVSVRLGHAQTSTTMNIYCHALRKSDKEAAKALEICLSSMSKTEARK